MASFDINGVLAVPGLPGLIKRIDKQLAQAVAGAHPTIKKPLLQIVCSSSKRLRCSLLIASMLGHKFDKNALTACTAIELAHLGSLVHDDIIDNSASRWSKPSTAQDVGTSQALLVGDYLLARSCYEASSLSAETGQLVAATIAILIQGEALEVNYIGKLGRTKANYFKCIRSKTAALFSTACYLGASIAGLSPVKSMAMGGYGENLGISFQLLDDLLDLLSTDKLLGKPTGADAPQGIYTLPVLISLSGPDKAQLKKILDKSSIFNKQMVDFLLIDGSIQKTIEEIQKYNMRAQACLNNINSPGLTAFPMAYTNWALNNLVKPEYQSEVIGL